MKPFALLSLLAFILPLNGHAQQRIEELIKNAQANKTDIEITTTIRRDPTSLKVESEFKYIVFKDKALSTQIKEALTKMSEQATTFEKRTTKDEEVYNLTFKPSNGGKINYYFQERKEDFALQIRKYAKE